MSTISTQRASYAPMPRVHLGSNKPRKQELLSDCDKLLNKLYKLQNSPELYRNSGDEHLISTAIEHLNKTRRSLRIMISK